MSETDHPGMVSEVNAEPQSGKVLIWDLPLRIFHWTLAAAFAGAYFLAESERLRNVHVVLGYTVLGLIGFRLLWGVAGTRWARFRSFAFGPRALIEYITELVTGHARRYIGHNPAGSWAIFGMILLALLTGVTGWCTEQNIGGEGLEDLHGAIANAWAALVVVHVAGVVVESWVHRENLVAAMVTGYKRGTRGDATGASRWRAGVALAVLVGGFWMWCALAKGLPWGSPQAGRANGPGSAEHSGMPVRDSMREAGD